MSSHLPFALFYSELMTPIDLANLQRIIEGERRLREECHAGTRPWKIPPGTDPAWPDGLAGMTPEEAAAHARHLENVDILFRELGIRPRR